MNEEHEGSETDREGEEAADDEGEDGDGPLEETETVVETSTSGDDAAGSDDAPGSEERDPPARAADADEGTAVEADTDADEDSPAEPADAESGQARALEKRAQRLDQREMGLDSRAEKLDEREERLDEREEGLVEERETLAEQRTALDEREEAIADREQELDEREAALDQRQQELEEYSAELDRRDQTLREYVGDQVGDSVESVVTAAMEEHAEGAQAGRFGPTGGLVLGLSGLVLVVGGVANALAIETGAFSAVLGSTTGNVVLSAAVILVGLTANLAAATDRV